MISDSSAAGMQWRVSSWCEGGQCVEIGYRKKGVIVRDSADPEGNIVTVNRDEWRAFVAGVKDGDFDSL